MTHTDLFTKIGNIVSIFFLGVTLTDIETPLKILAALIAIGAGGSTWYHNYLKIRQLKKKK